MLFNPAAASATRPSSFSDCSSGFGIRPPAKGRFQPNASARVSARWLSARPFTRKWVAGVGVINLYPAPLRKEIKRDAATLAWGLSESTRSHILSGPHSPEPKDARPGVRLAPALEQRPVEA